MSSSAMRLTHRACQQQAAPQSSGALIAIRQASSAADTVCGRLRVWPTQAQTAPNSGCGV